MSSVSDPVLVDVEFGLGFLRWHLLERCLRWFIQSIEDIKLIPLGVSETGTSLTIADVATVTLGPQMRRGIAELNGEGEVVGGVVVMRYGENAEKTISGVKEKIESLKCL